ncbi:hypothetical protein F4775DRAFT_138625 [Biscogniauxia sp. FL1348]|nr:hypothetical protein F4775DRAFT_138625 [Biscogniauxia sp. FL1348]
MFTIMSHSQKDSATDWQRYSNANLAKLFDDRNIEEWRTTKSSVNVFQNRTDIDTTLRTENDDQAHIHCVITKNFNTSCNDLKGYLSCFPRPVQDVFPPKNRSAQPGEIRLEIATASRTHIILWIYHNVFVRMELLSASKPGQSVESSDVEPPTWSFKDLADRLFRYIREGSVSARSEVDFPKILGIKRPESIIAGETFEVLVDVNLRCLDNVECDDDNLVLAGSEDIGDGSRKYTFFATTAGTFTIYFYFAHHNTLNFESREMIVSISEAETES